MRTPPMSGRSGEGSNPLTLQLRDLPSHAARKVSRQIYFFFFAVFFALALLAFLEAVFFAEPAAFITFLATFFAGFFFAVFAGFAAFFALAFIAGFAETFAAFFGAGLGGFGALGRDGGADGLDAPSSSVSS